ncbi:DUF1178 family protein [Erythrobacter crassostreae]|uniref:DUF1178 family protein n=1 Tax=Erythrobacter crassostreae TaxID=2828328 RepID=A0A9X1F508_9SPHN|nr:DUF1178 family protein [Erythrobacter crassostrea]MBV7260252.1 DUF1178 family protein [Erythrobacter crassostrea]
MIVYDLHCEHGHRFEGWFGSSTDFEDQQSGGLISCPECGSEQIGKALMAPAVPVKTNTKNDVPVPSVPASAKPVSNQPIPAEVEKAMQALARAQEKALQKSTWVGEKFVEQSREMHYGERDEAPIHGQATLEEAKSLVDEGVQVAPLPFPVAPPDKLN